jgi:hypothetical protein
VGRIPAASISATAEIGSRLLNEFTLFPKQENNSMQCGYVLSASWPERTAFGADFNEKN